jgi:hypothetical protein
MTPTATEQFEHINLNDVDTTASRIDTGYYTLELNQLTVKYVKINKPTSPYAGQEVLVLKGWYTIVDDDKYSGRKLFHEFWTPFTNAKKSLALQMKATGVIQEPNQSLPDYAAQFATLNPPARFQVQVEKVPGKDGEGDENRINFFTAKPV